MLGQSNEEICEFVKNTSACHLDEQFFSYIDDLFCVQANYEFYLRFTGMVTMKNEKRLKFFIP